MAIKDKKTRKKGRKGLVVLLVILVLLAVAFFAVHREIAGGRPGEPVAVTVEKGSSTGDIASSLHDAGLIKSEFLFRLYSRMTGADGGYQYGEFSVPEKSGYKAIIEALSSTVSFKETVTVTFPEGYNAFQMAEVLEKSGLCTADEFLKAADSRDYDFDFMDEISDDARKLVTLDGFLFPDTYSFYPEDDARKIVTAMLANFEKKVLTEETKKALAASDYSLEELVIFASIIQKESANVEEMYNVSSVFTNRMQNDSEYPQLQSCTTNNYFWDYIEPYYSNNVPQQIVDAYDTYGKVGLPVGAIANPGTDAVDAALHPNDTPYYFFVTDVEYTHYYGRTYAEHQANIKKAEAVNREHGIEGLVTR